MGSEMCIRDRARPHLDPRALEMGREGVCVVIAGKGHETYQEIRGVRLPFNDREVATAALAQWEAGAR